MKLGEKNVGRTDRLARALIGIVLFLAYFSGGLFGLPAFLFFILGILLLLSALCSSCAIYSLFGINTERKKR